MFVIILSVHETCPLATILNLLFKTVPARKYKYVSAMIYEELLLRQFNSMLVQALHVLLIKN